MGTRIKISDKELLRIIQSNLDKSVTGIYKLSGVSAPRIKRIAEKNALQLQSPNCTNEETERRIKYIRDNPLIPPSGLAKHLEVEATVIYKLALKHNLKIIRKVKTFKEKQASKNKRIAFIKANPQMSRIEMSEALGMKKTTLYDLVKSQKLEYKHSSGVQMSAYTKRADGLFLDLNSSEKGRKALNDFLSSRWS